MRERKQICEEYAGLAQNFVSFWTNNGRNKLTPEMVEELKSLIYFDVCSHRLLGFGGMGMGREYHPKRHADSKS